jgi:hypothetical protein
LIDALVTDALLTDALLTDALLTDALILRCVDFTVHPPRFDRSPEFQLSRNKLGRNFSVGPVSVRRIGGATKKLAC